MVPDSTPHQLYADRKPVPTHIQKSARTFVNMGALLVIPGGAQKEGASAQCAASSCGQFWRVMVVAWEASANGSLSVHGSHALTRMCVFDRYQ